MDEKQIIDWLLKGDVAIQYQVYRDLLGIERKDLQERIANEGWGKRFLDKRKSNGHWGTSFYQSKWISTHYTLLDLRHLNLAPDNPLVQQTIAMVLATLKAEDGGIKLGPSTKVHSDVCVNGMFLNYASYFKSEEQPLKSIIDSLLHLIMSDGGFNCLAEREGTQHSSLHTTLSVLEGLNEFKKAGHTYRKKEIENAEKSGREFMLQHHLFLSDKTGEIISKNFLKLSYPGRWKYDILRALDYLQYAHVQWDERMQEAIEVILKKKNKSNTWNLQAPHPGMVHFVMEPTGAPSRWNTLRALRVLKQYKINN